MGRDALPLSSTTTVVTSCFAARHDCFATDYTRIQVIQLHVCLAVFKKGLQRVHPDVIGDRVPFDHTR